MLVHIRPRIISTRPVRLVDFEVEGFGLDLRGDVDLAIGHPYPNKTYSVAYRKGQRHLDGIVLSLPQGVTAFRTVTRWAVDAETMVLHLVDYSLLDQDFDLASDNMVLWYGYDGKPWKSRFPDHPEGHMIPVQWEPTMAAEPFRGGQPRRCDVAEQRDSRGWRIFLHQAFAMPTIEPERLWGDFKWQENRRAPPAETAFKLVGG